MIPSERRQPLSVSACQDPQHPRLFSAPAATKSWSAGLHPHVGRVQISPADITNSAQLCLSHLWGSPGSYNTEHTVPGTLLSLLRNKGHKTQFQGLRWQENFSEFTGGNTPRQVLITCCMLGPVLGQVWAGNLQSLIIFLLIKTSTGLL